MILLLHVVIALLSMGWAGYTYVRPSKKSLSISYGLMTATLTTGTYLVIMAPAHLAQACLVGIGYLLITAGASVLARNKLKLAAQ